MAKESLLTRWLTNILALYVMVFYLIIVIAMAFGVFQLVSWPLKTIELWPTWGIFLFIPFGLITLAISVRYLNLNTIKKHILNFG